ncbi:uncharacterized protein LOC111586893 isoform X2 [Amphiprion ocellaris]|nr:uncharacterized protein LOC111586893 isoform X2 [Amphiprion ocellaris]
MPFITEFQDRWPALFSESELNAEFTRITTVPLLSRIMSKLDHYTNQLMKVFRKKGGAAGHKMSMIVAAMDKNPTVETRRECILKALCVYLNGNPENFIKDYVVVEPGAMRAMEEKVMEIYVIRHEGAEPTESPEDVGIIIEGVEVLQDLRDVANGCAVLFGLIYSLNLTYPKRPEIHV